MPDPFITVAQLGDSLGLTLTGNAAATLAVEDACDICRAITEQVITEVEEDILVVDGTGTETIVLPQLPVTDVSLVLEDDEELVEGTDYAVDNNGVLKRLPTVVDQSWSTQTVRRRWALGQQNVEIVYTHGYAAADIPKDLRRAALSIAQRLFQQKTSAVYETLGQYSVRYDGSPTDLTTGEKLILDKYRRGHPLAVGATLTS